MYHPTSRVLAVLELLQSRHHMSGPELARRLEVDERTVRRYIILIQEVGIPIEVIIGRYGGYRLRRGFKLPPLMFTNDEALALTLGLQAVQKMGVHAIAPAIEGAMAKIERVLPDDVRPRIQAIHDMLVVDINSPDAQIKLPILESISTAAQQCRQILLSYNTEQGEKTERIIDPYGVACHNGRWYTVGYCHLRAELRIFRLDRIEQTQMQQEMFIRPPDFHCLPYIIQTVAAIPDTWNVEVLLKISLEEAHSKVPPMLATLEQHPQGVVLYASIANLNWMARFLVGLDCAFMIRRPAELRVALQELAEEMSQLAQWVGADS